MDTEVKLDNINAQMSAFSSGEPVRMVKCQKDMEDWQHSQAYYDLMGFINGISTSIQGKRISDEIFMSATMNKLLDILVALNTHIDETPIVDQPQRFGNKGYRNWARKMYQDIFSLLRSAVPPELCEYTTELGYYLSESFGNSVRIDYGTGHELSFIFFLCGLFKAGILKERDSVACALQLFYKYLLLVRRLQTTYNMEPAGSQGVWSLDDFQFMPFIWGSAQLAYKSPFDPSKFLDEDIINEYKNDYMFISCIDYISKVKTGHFAEHSNQLWSISAVPAWSKINSGLVKMYQKEILSKYPIIQHVYFGQLMPYASVKTGTTIANARLGIPPAPAKPAVTMAPPPQPPSTTYSTSDVTSTSSQSNQQSASKTDNTSEKSMEI